MAYHEAGTRVRVNQNVVVPRYRMTAKVIPKGSEGVVVKPFPGEEAYAVLLDGRKDSDDTEFLYDYEVEAVARVKGESA